MRDVHRVPVGVGPETGRNWGRAATSAVVVSMLALVGNVVTPAGASADTGVVFVGTPKIDRRFTVNSDSSRTSSSFVVTGTLVDDGGAPVANTQLAVNLDPAPAMQIAADAAGQGATGLPLSAVKTDAKGHFSLPVPALKNIGQYVDADGIATLLFMSFDAKQDLVFRQDVRLPSAPGEGAHAPLDDEKVFKSARTVAARSKSGTSVLPELTGVTLTAKRTPTKARARAVNAASECTRTWGTAPWASYQWKREGTPTRNWVPVQHVETGGHTKVAYDWSNTTETSLEIAVKYEYKGVGAKGGYAHALLVSAGINFDLGNYYTRDLDVSYDFYDYRLWCTLSGDATKVRDSKVIEVRPYHFAGYNRSTTYRTVYHCTPAYKDLLGHALWVSRKTTTTFSAGLSLKGVEVGVKQINTAEHKKTFTPTRDGATICGQGNDPVSTEKVMGD